MLRFLLKLTPESTPLNLDPYLVKGGYSNQVEIAAEDGLNSFRGSQIQLTLDDRKNRFTTGTHTLAGGEEISIIREDNSPLWSGTIDPASITKDPDQNNLVIRVLQHGSLLNTVFAGLPDWYIDANGQLITNTEHYFRYRGKADNWADRRDQHANFLRNEIVEEDAEIFFTPTAKAAIADDLYRAQFSERVYHFHTAHKDVGGIEYPFSFIRNQNSEEQWHGQFKQHEYPDFAERPQHWESSPLTRPGAAYLRNPTPTLPFFRQSIPDILAELVRQFNRTAKFPLLFDPATDCVIISPRIDQQIEILKRSPDVENIDLQHYPATPTSPPRTLMVVNWGAGASDPRTLRFSLFEISNETELVTRADRVAIPFLSTGYTWPTFGRGMRFARASTSTTGTNIAFVYTMRWNLNNVGQNYVLEFQVHHGAISLTNTSIQAGLRMFNVLIHEQLGAFPHPPQPPLYVVNRSAALNSSGAAYVRQQTPPYQPLPPEFEPQQQITVDNRIYRTNNGGLVVSGALFDRVAVDAVNTKLAALISDLAKLTHSRWFVTPDRRLKFLSRQCPGTVHSLKSSRLLKGLETVTETFDESELPPIGQSLVLPDNFRQAHTNWGQDNILYKKAQGFKANIPLEDLDPFPLIGDSINLQDPAIPPVQDPIRKQKYGGAYPMNRAIVEIDNQTVQLTTTLPTL